MNKITITLAGLSLVAGCSGDAGDDRSDALAASAPASPIPIGPAGEQSIVSANDSAGPSGAVAEDAALIAAEPPAAEPVAPDTNPDVSVPPMPVNPFVSVAHDPLSTFAADVDTASYDIFERDVRNGFLPDPRTVRLEEFVNYFEYDYPAPEGDAEHPFAIDLAAAPHFLDNGTTLLRVGIQGKMPDPFVKRPANLVFLVDVSGSMQSEVKLPLVQRVLTGSLGMLEPTDTVSIVTYASGTGVRLEPTPVSNADTISATINSLTAGGSTNGSGGIQLAYEQASAAFIEDGINHVVLCTDGDFNVGITGNQLVPFIEEKRETGITFTALGFGASNNDSMMEAISNAGNGVYGVISSSDQADRYVESRLLSTINHIAKDMKIQVEFNPEHVLAYRLLGYENREIADQDFRNDVVDAGEIGEGHRVTALYELVMAGGVVPEPADAPTMEIGEDYSGEVEIDPSDLVLVKVRYKDVNATAEDAAYEVAETLSPEAVAESHTALDGDFRWAAATATFAEILKQSPYATEGSMGALSDIFEAEQAGDGDRQTFFELFGLAQQLISNGSEGPRAK